MTKKERIIDAIAGDTTRGKLDLDEMNEIAGRFKVGVSKVESIRSFYEFGEEPDRICTGLPCRMKHSIGDGSGSQLGNLPGESCLGFCDHAPVIRKGGKFYTLKHGDMLEIEESKESFVAENRENLQSYELRNGYKALKEVLKRADGSSITNSIEESGLKGMGGAGFPVLVKWKSFAENRTPESYLLVNAHEGEPGTFKDREFMEMKPHQVIDGILLTALANEIKKVVIGLKVEYSNANRSLKSAIDELKKSLSEKEFDLLPTVEIRETGGSYVTGEETALMEAIEGGRSEPRLRPPFPTEKGLYGNPTLVQNIETLSVIAQLSNSGSTEIEKSYCLTGDVKKPGSYNAKLGTSVREMLTRFAESDDSDVKAFMPGGLSGGILPKEYLDLKLDFDSVRKAGAGMGTGALIALSNDRCIVDSARTVSDFFKDESCGKCMPCRYGTNEISTVLAKLAEGKADQSDIDSAAETARVMLDGSICALGQVAGKTFIDSLKYFSNEIAEHLDGNCPTHVCKMDGDGR